MHFWIDKRSQTYGFGRARVAASLSGGTGVGLGFGHPPRRMGGKSSFVPPSVHHRFQSPADISHRLHHSSSSSQQQSHTNSSLANNTSSSSSSSSSQNRIRNANNSSHNNQHHHQNHRPQQQHQSQVQQHSGSGNHHTRLQNGSTGGGGHQQANINNAQNFIQRQNIVGPPIINQQPQASNHLHHHQEYHVGSVALPLYGNSSHTPDLEQGSLGLGPLPTTRSNMTPGVASALARGNGIMVDAAESQLLPSHLKCGMWASLVLASVFVAGAKFYFDHQGTGLEVLIFCAFSATFFLAACTVSLCRLPRDWDSGSASISIDGHHRGLDGGQIHHGGLHHANAQHQVFAHQQQLVDGSLTDHNIVMHHQSNAANSAPPPPYHIAILLPENSKELEPDESPPPSYDKILV